MPEAILVRLRGGVRGARGWRRRGISLASGALSLLAMAPFNFWPVLFLTLPVLVFLLDGVTRGGRGWRMALAAGETGWWFAFGYHFLGLMWIGEAFLVQAEQFAWAMPFAVSLLPAGLALFLALAVAAYAVLELKGLARVAGFAVTVGLAEFARGHVLTGLPWNVIGYALTSPLVLMQSARVVGIYGLTLVTVVVATLPLVMAADAAGSPGFARAARSGVLAAAAVLAVLLGYGTLVLSTSRHETLPGVRLRIVQPSVPQREKWMRDKQREIFDLHLALSRMAANGTRDDLQAITHVIWPEAAMPFLPLDSPQALTEIGELLGSKSYLITGALRAERANASAEIPSSSHAIRVFNSLMAFGMNGDLIALYDKIHLVPFGEYLPLPWLFNAIGLEELTRMRGGFNVGMTPRPLFLVPGLPRASPLICYEMIFPAAVVQGRERPQLILNVTNDGWFGNTTGPRQHLHQARVRAVEEGVPVVRAANNGISALIDGNGRVVQHLDLDVRGVIDADLPAALAPPPYARFGDGAFWLGVFGLSSFALWLCRFRVSR